MISRFRNIAFKVKQQEHHGWKLRQTAIPPEVFQTKIKIPSSKYNKNKAEGENSFPEEKIKITGKTP